MSIIITIISNITVLGSHNAICFEHFMPMSPGVNKKAAPIVSNTPPPYQVYTRFVCFTRNTLSTIVSSRVSAPPLNIDLIPFYVAPTPKNCKSVTLPPQPFMTIHPPLPKNFGELDYPPPLLQAPLPLKMYPCSKTQRLIF